MPDMEPNRIRGVGGTKEKMLLSTFLTHDNTSQNGIPLT